MLSIEELKVTFAKMREAAMVVAKSQPSVAAGFETDIASFENALANNPTQLDVGAIVKTASDLTSALQAAKSSK